MKFRIKKEHYHGSKIIYVPQFKRFLLWWPYFESTIINGHDIDWPIEFDNFEDASNYLKKKMEERVNFVEYEEIQN